MRARCAAADRRIELTPTEFNLLHYLLANAGRVVSKAQILDHVWRYDFGGDSSVVETYISYLRKKIDAGRGHRSADPDRARIRVRHSRSARLTCRCGSD